MSVRVSIPLLIALILIGIFLFFSFYIVRAALNNKRIDAPKQPLENVYRFEQPKPQVDNHRPMPANVLQPPLKTTDTTEWSEPVQHEEPHQEVPHVTGQTEEDLTAPEPLQETPPTTFYEPPEATDPMNKTVHMPSTFGRNLRHPEQMIEKHPRRNMKVPIKSGVASENTFNFGRQETMYSEEMIQNGGVMDDGITAHDVANSGAVNGLGFSMI